MSDVVMEKGDSGSQGMGKDAGVTADSSSVAAGDVGTTRIVKQTHRNLKPRHVQMLALSGAIGTGLFVGTGSVLARAGPAGLFLGYLTYAMLVWSTFNAMGEMVVWLPIDGSFVVFAHTYLDPAWGFALGWLYTVTNGLTTAAEAVAVATIVRFWTDSVNSGVWIAIVITSMLLFNIFGVRFYGEGEFYFSMFKIFLILGLLMMTFIVMVGGNPQGDAFGFRYWKNPGPFNSYVAEGRWGHFLGFWSVFIQAAFAFGGPDFIALSAGETSSPRRVLPIVFRRVIYRLAVFYILGVIAVGILVPYNDPALVAGSAGAGSSPFVIGIKRLGIPVLPHIINALLMTSAWSCGIELFYASSRALYSLALQGKAPKVLLFTWRGVPTFCCVVIWAITLLSFMAASESASTVFNWLTSIIGSGNLLVYVVFHITYIRFRHAQKAQGITDEQRPWFRRHQYYYSIASLFFYVIIYLTNAFRVFTTGNWSTPDFIFGYFSLALFTVCYVGYKVVMRPSFGTDATVDLTCGQSADTRDDLDAGLNAPRPTTFMGKVSYWFWG